MYDLDFVLTTKCKIIIKLTIAVDRDVCEHPHVLSTCQNNLGVAYGYIKNFTIRNCKLQKL